MKQAIALFTISFLIMGFGWTSDGSDSDRAESNSYARPTSAVRAASTPEVNRATAQVQTMNQNAGAQGDARSQQLAQAVSSAARVARDPQMREILSDPERVASLRRLANSLAAKK